MTIAERAHIVAHSPEGPRGRSNRTPPEIDDPTNLVLMCPSCHTKVDKVPEDYPEAMLLDLKARRAAAVARIGGVVRFASRSEARAAAELLLLQNRETFTQFGPDSEDGSLPTQEATDKWRQLVLTEIVPRNELLVSLVEVNPEFANESDKLAAERLRAHTRDLAAKHGSGPLLAPVERFPTDVENIFLGSDDE